MNILIDDIKQRLSEVGKTLSAAYQFAYISTNWGQIHLFEHPPVKYPCALVEITNADYKNEGAKSQRVNVNIEITIAELILSNSSFKAPTNQTEKAERLYLIVNDVQALLHGWRKKDSLYSALERKNFRKVNRQDGIREFILTFNCDLVDNNAAKRKTISNLKPVINTVKIEKPI